MHDAETAARLDFAALTPARDPYYYLCSGSYVEPPTPAGATASDERLHVLADDLEYEQGKTATVAGSVDLRQGLRTLSADSARYNEVAKTVSAEGNIILREPGLVVVAQAGEMDLTTKAAQASDASYLIHDGRTRGVR